MSRNPQREKAGKQTQPARKLKNYSLRTRGNVTKQIRRSYQQHRADNTGIRTQHRHQSLA